MQSIVAAAASAGAAEQQPAQQAIAGIQTLYTMQVALPLIGDGRWWPTGATETVVAQGTRHTGRLCQLMATADSVQRARRMCLHREHSLCESNSSWLQHPGSMCRLLMPSFSKSCRCRKICSDNMQMLRIHSTAVTGNGATAKLRHRSSTAKHKQQSKTANT
jgi:hypothetical protein